MWYRSLLMTILLFLVNCGQSSEDLLLIDSKTSGIYTGSSLKLPLSPGYKWKVNTEAGTGYCGPDDGPPDHKDCYDTFHVNHYAIDFGRHIKDNQGAPNSFGDGVVDIFAAADGVVTSNFRKTGCGNPSPVCKVTIDHGGGYTTQYLHFSTDTIMVNPMDNVVQGQYLGKMGNTGQSFGTHLHFEVFHDGSSSTSNTDLDGLTLEGLDFKGGYKYANYLPSTNGFTFTPASDNPHTCFNEPVGGSPCTRATNFNVGERVWPNLRLDNLTRDICFKIEFYLGSTKKAESGEWCSDRIESDGGWTQAYLWGNFIPREAGTNWNARYFVRLKNGGASYLPDPAGMAVTPNFIVNNIPIPSTPTLISPISVPAFPPTTRVNASPITLRWTNSVGANFYDIAFFMWNGSNWDQVGFWGVIGGPVNVIGVPTNTYCAWEVAACNDSGCSSWSDVGYFQTLP